MEQNELRVELLKTMNQISCQMRDIILLNYFDKLGNDKRYCLSMMIDAYQTMDVFCYAMQHINLAQAGFLLRQLLEQVTISYILVDSPEALSKYIEHFKLRFEWSKLKKGEQRAKIAEKFRVPKNHPNTLFRLWLAWVY